jgi:hypothetical protein
MFWMPMPSRFRLHGVSAEEQERVRSLLIGFRRAGRSRHWLNVKNRQRPAMSRVMEAFA